MLDIAKRSDEAEALIQQFKVAFAVEPDFATAWARHALRLKNKAALSEIAKSPAIERLRPSVGGLIYFHAGLTEQAVRIADSALKEIRQREVPRREFDELGRFFQEIERWDDFEKVTADAYPRELMDLRERLGIRPTPRR